MNKRNLSLMAFVLSFSLLLSGCMGTPPAKDTDDVTDTPGVANTETKAPKGMDDIDAANAKLASYIDCINDHSERALDSFDRYTMWADEATGPTGQEQNIYGLFTLPLDTKKCIDGIAASVKMKPAYAALDKVATEYSTALVNLVPVLKEANEYYEEKNYLDDAMAKGKEMHPKLIAAFKAFETADATMRTELEAITDELDAKELTLIEKQEGKKYPYLTKSLMILAKKLVDEGSVSADKLQDVNVDSFQKNITAYETAVDALKAYDVDHKEELGPGLGASSFISDANDYLVTAKEMMRRIRDKKEYDSIELMHLENGNGQLVGGSPDKLVDDYNGLVDSHNFMY